MYRGYSCTAQVTVMPTYQPCSLPLGFIGHFPREAGLAGVPLVTGVRMSLSAVTHAPFHASVLRPASQVGPMHKTAGMGKLIIAALLSLINEACVSVCCATLLLSQLVGPACVQARSSNLKGRACGSSGKGSGRRGY